MDAEVTLNVEKRASKGRTLSYWYLRWYGADGTRYGKCVGRVEKVSPRQAEKLRQVKQNDLDQHPGRRDAGRAPELAAFIDTYVESRRGDIGDGTMDLHRQTGRYLVGHFGPLRRIDTITRAEARAFKTALSQGKLSHVNSRRREKPPGSPTVDRHVREARVIFAKAVADDYIVANPFDKLGGGKPTKKEWHYVPADEFARLLAACRPGWKLMVGLARWAALRAEEALELPWRKVDLAMNRITLESRGDWSTKDRETRVVPIVPELQQLLREALDRRGQSEFVVPPGEVVASNIWRDFGTVLKRAGLKRYPQPMHALRKSCITDWASTHPAHVVMEWAGDEDYRTTVQHYLKVSDGDYRRAASRPLARPHSAGSGPESEVVEMTPQLASSGSPRSTGGRDSQETYVDAGSPSGRPEVTTADGDGEPSPQTQERTQTGELGVGGRHKSRAGEGIRTPDVQLGKLAFYH